jgi:hypothetical protein
MAALLALSLFGCAAKHLSPSRLPEAPDPVPGYSALCAAKWKGPRKTWRARVAVAFLPPAGIRLEVLDPAGSSRWALIATEKGALVLDATRRTFRSYPDARMATSDLVGIAAMPQSLARLLLGPAVLRSAPECSEGTLGEGEVFRRCPLPGGGTLLFRIGEERRALLAAPGEVMLELSWGDGSSGVRSLPSWVELRQKTPSVELRLDTEELRFSLPEPSLFTLSPPSGFSPAFDGTIP